MFYGIWLPYDFLDLHGPQLPYISLTSETLARWFASGVGTLVGMMPAGTWRALAHWACSLQNLENPETAMWSRKAGLLEDAVPHGARMSYFNLDAIFTPLDQLICQLPDIWVKTIFDHQGSKRPSRPEVLPIDPQNCQRNSNICCFRPEFGVDLSCI